MNQNRLFVGNLPYSSNEADLESLFADHGEVVDTKIITDRDTGRSRGFGFVTFANDDEAEAALSLNGQDMGGRRLVVNVAHERGGGRGPGRAF